MKFAKYIDDNAIPEWKRAYFDYKKGKKLIKRVADQSVTTRRQTSRTFSPSNSSPATPLVSPRARDDTYGSTDSRRDTDESGSLSPGLGSPAMSAPDREPSLASPTKLATTAKPPRRRNNTASTSKSRNPTILDGTDYEMSSADETVSTFFNFVREELDKINKFYTDREAEAGKRLNDLRGQLQEMKDRKHQIGSRQIMTQAERKAIERADYTKPTTWLMSNMRSLFNYADIDFLDTHPIDDDARKETQAQLQLMYRVARRRLKIASQEFYQSLEMLRSYRTLNRTALVKVMKKFDKTAKMRASPAMVQSFDNDYYIGSSDFLERMMHKAEDFYAKYYFHGDRKHAIAALRTKEHTEDYRFTMLRVGLYFGLSIPLAIEGLVRSQYNRQDNQLTVYLLQVWGAFFFLILMSVFFGLNCYVCASDTNWLIVDMGSKQDQLCLHIRV